MARGRQRAEVGRKLKERAESPRGGGGWLVCQLVGEPALRARRHSKKRLWLSCTPIEVASPSGQGKK